MKIKTTDIILKHNDCVSTNEQSEFLKKKWVAVEDVYKMIEDLRELNDDGLFDDGDLRAIEQQLNEA